MDKISVVVPVYNVEDYLTKCIKSIINQTHHNLEIICVNDGSSDNSQKILKEFQKIDNRIIVITQENHGVSSARNRALNVASGKYITFVDPDDWIESNFYEIAIKNLEETEADIFCSGIYDEFEYGTIKRENSLHVKDIITDKNELFLYVFKRDFYRNFGVYLWNKVYKAELFKNVTFNEDLFVGEDLVTFTEVALKADKFTYTDTAYYHYLQRANSLTHKINLEKTETRLDAYSIAIKAMENGNISQECLAWVKRFRTYHASNLAEIALEQKDSDKLEKYKNEIRKYLAEYIETNKEFPERIKRIKKILEYKL